MKPQKSCVPDIHTCHLCRASLCIQIPDLAAVAMGTVWMEERHINQVMGYSNHFRMHPLDYRFLGNVEQNCANRAASISSRKKMLMPSSIKVAWIFNNHSNT